MRQESCGYEDRVLTTSNEDTAKHVASCAYCSEALRASTWMKALAAEEKQMGPLPDADLIWIEAALGRREQSREALLEGIVVAILVVCAPFAMREGAMSSAIMVALMVIILTFLVWPVSIED